MAELYVLLGLALLDIEFLQYCAVCLDRVVKSTCPTQHVYDEQLNYLSSQLNRCNKCVFEAVHTVVQ